MLTKKISEPIVKDLNWWQGFLHKNYYGSPEEQAHWEYVAKLIYKKTGLTPNSRVLELGSGSGELIINLAQKGCRVTGVEISPYLTEHSYETASNRGLLVDIRNEDMFEYSPREKFDLIISVNTSFGYGSYEQNLNLLHKIPKWLNKGGKFYFDVITADHAREFGKWHETVNGGRLTVYNRYNPSTKLMNSDIKWVSRNGELYTTNEPEVVQLYSRAELVSIMEQGGLKVKRLQSAMDRAFRQSEKSEFTTWLAVKE